MNDPKHWRVSVETSGDTIVAIEPEMLAGREISDEDEGLIRTAAHHLLSFIGDPTASPISLVLVTDTFDRAKAEQAFADYFVRNYPGPDTIIFDPKWHAPKLFAAALQAIKEASNA